MTAFLFDFDGTLADSLAAIVTITNRLAPEFGYRPTPLAELERVKGFSTRQLIRYSGISIFKIPALMRRLSAELRDHGPQFPPFADIPEVIQTLHQQNYTLAIVTSNTPDIVRAFLVAYGMADCFRSIDGGGTLFGKGRIIKRCLQVHDFDPETTVYVGDEVRDVEAARFANVRSVAVTWGFNSAAVLATAQPDWLIDEPKALQAIADAI